MKIISFLFSGSEKPLHPQFSTLFAGKNIMRINFFAISLMTLVMLLISHTSMMAAAKGEDLTTRDARIEEAAKNSYVFKRYLQNDNILVQSNDCIVTLSGEVEDESHKALAQETVENLSGVKRVVNNLKFSGEPPAKNSDLWLVAKLKTALLFHRHVSSLTEVTSKDGIITLRGVADSQAEKDLTTEYAKDINGVKEVKNEMTVALSPNSKESISEVIDDASITTQVKTALMSHRSTSVINTKVSTKDGVVTVHGKAKNAAEIKLVSKLAENIKGVVSVDNKMTIEESK